MSTRSIIIALVASTSLACAHSQTAAKAGATNAASPGAAEPTAEELLLGQAKKHVQAGEYDEARQLLASVLERWPAEPVAGEAHYVVGESYFAQQRCREALFAFGRVMQDFPASPSAPTAYLRSAACFRLLNMPAEATLALEELKKQYAENDAAQEADRLLSELKRPRRARAVRR